MILINFKKTLIGIIALIFLSGCAQNAALIGPAYTIATTGNVYHAGITYGSSEIVSKTTGKSISQNFKEAFVIKKEDTNFQKLVKKNIKETRKKLNLSNQ